MTDGDNVPPNVGTSERELQRTCGYKFTGLVLQVRLSSDKSLEGTGEVRDGVPGDVEKVNAQRICSLLPFSFFLKRPKERLVREGRFWCAGVKETKENTN